MTSLAICVFRSDRELCSLTWQHTSDTDLPTLDHLSFAYIKDEGIWEFGMVEYFTIFQSADIVDNSLLVIFNPVGLLISADYDLLADLLVISQVDCF